MASFKYIKEMRRPKMNRGAASFPLLVRRDTHIIACMGLGPEVHLLALAKPPCGATGVLYLIVYLLGILLIYKMSRVIHNYSSKQKPPLDGGFLLNIIDGYMSPFEDHVIIPF
jgi:4-hydroxybenzoate polyprenyltransferase